MSSRREFITLLGGAVATAPAYVRSARANKSCTHINANGGIVADQSQTDREIIARLWDILDDPQLNQALGITQNARFMLNSKETLTPRLYPPCSVRLPSISVLEIWSVVKCRMTTSTFLAEHRDC